MTDTPIGNTAEKKSRMIQVADFIKELQELYEKWGNTCIYIRPLGMSWGAAALNYQADDEKNGVFDLKAEYNRRYQAHAEQVERLCSERDSLLAERNRLREQLNLVERQRDNASRGMELFAKSNSEKDDVLQRIADWDKVIARLKEGHLFESIDVIKAITELARAALSPRERG